MHIGKKNYKNPDEKKKYQAKNRERGGGGRVGFLLPTEIHNKHLDSNV